MSKTNNPLRDAVLSLVPERGKLISGHNYFVRDIGVSQKLLVAYVDGAAARVFRIEVAEVTRPNNYLPRTPSSEVEAIVRDVERIREYEEQRNGNLC